MDQQVTNLRLVGNAEREVIPLKGGVVAYGPTEGGGYWRLRWLEHPNHSAQDLYVSPDGDLFERFFELTR